MGRSGHRGETTVLNPPYGTVIPGDGFLSIQIYGLNVPSPPADTANLVNVPVTVTPITTLATGLTSGTANISSLSVTGLTNPVAAGDSITIGSGSTTQVVTAQNAVVVGTGTQTIAISPTFTANANYAAGTSVHDAAWTATTYNPDQYGCVYLLEPLGYYTVSLASPSGGPKFIDYQENLTPSSPNQDVTVSGLPVFVPTFHYDEAGTVTFSPSAAAPIATGMPISVSNGSNLLSGIATMVPAGGSATSALLFPYSSAYSVWYGDCQPPPHGSTMEEPATPATVSVTPKGSSSVSITGLGVLTVNATRSSGSFTPGDVSATATITDANAVTGTGADGCPVADSTGGETFGLVGLSGSGSAYSSQTAILPQTYKVTVTDSASGGGSASTTVTVGASGATATVTVP